MTPQTEKLLQSLAGKFGVTVQYLWQVLIHGTRVEGVVMVVFSVLMLGLIYGGYRLIRYGIDSDEEGFIPAGGVVGIFAIIFFGIFSYSAVIDLYAPEYAALLTILDKIKN